MAKFWVSYWLQDGRQTGATLEAKDYNDIERQLMEMHGDMYGDIADYGEQEDDRDIHERLQLVRAMDLIVRNLNDEEMMEAWLMCGVADGDIKEDTPDEYLEYYAEDDTFASLMALFCRTMRWAINSPDLSKEEQKNGNYILYCDGIVGKKEEN